MDNLNSMKTAHAVPTMSRPTSLIVTMALAFGVGIAQADTPAASATHASIIDRSTMDVAVRPGDDFFEYANGKWLATASIPADHSSLSVGQRLDDDASTNVRNLVTEAAAHTGPQASALDKAGDLYAAFVDEDRIARAGLKPAESQLAGVLAIRSASDLASAFATLYRNGVDVPFHVYVHRDMKDSTVFAAYLGQGGLGLPGVAYYTDPSERGRSLRAAYLAYIQKEISLAGLSDAAVRAQGILDLETRLASTHWTEVQNRDVQAHYNPMSPEEINHFAPGVDWPGYLASSGVGGVHRVIVSQPSALKGAAALMTEVPIEAWRDYLAFHVLATMSPVLPAEFARAKFSFEKGTLRGVAREQDRSTLAVAMVNESMGDAIGQAYVARYFPPAAKAKAETMVRLLLNATAACISQATWMSDTTRAMAKTKLDGVTMGVGYPDKWTDYGSLHIDRNDAFGNQVRASQFAYDQEISQLSGKEAGNGWFMPPQAANAFANPFANEIVFPAGILQPPVFASNSDDAVNFGAIGAIIGHEISHLFDDQGRKFGATGQLLDWWAPASEKQFKSLADALAQQYSKYEPIKGTHIDGKLTLSENIADLAGLEIAYRAYHLSLDGRPAPVRDGLSGDQRFFLAFAQAWRGKSRPEALRTSLATDAHSPVRYRALTVRNLDAWYLAFNVKPGDTMYLPPSARIHMW